jgi:hypothetical protein
VFEELGETEVKGFGRTLNLFSFDAERVFPHL